MCRDRAGGDGGDEAQGDAVTHGAGELFTGTGTEILAHHDAGTGSNADKQRQQDAEEGVGDEVGAVIDQAGPGRGFPIEDAGQGGGKGAISRSRGKSRGV